MSSRHCHGARPVRSSLGQSLALFFGSQASRRSLSCAWAQSIVKRTPDTCAWLMQPRVAERSAMKSNISCISVPDRYITLIVFSKGNTLNIDSCVSGPA